MRVTLGIAALTLAISSNLASAGTLTDGDFSAWSFGSIGSATVTLENSGGNPGSRLNITNNSGSSGTVLGTAMKTDYATVASLAGASFTLALDVLNGPGDFGQGQFIDLLVQQGTNLYGDDLGITGLPSGSWKTVSFSSSFLPSSFTLLAGSGPSTPNFSGGIPTLFGFAGGNTASGTLTQYYDNFSLTSSALAAVPEPASVALLGIGLAVLGFNRRRL